MKKSVFIALIVLIVWVFLMLASCNQDQEERKTPQEWCEIYVVNGCGYGEWHYDEYFIATRELRVNADTDANMRFAFDAYEITVYTIDDGESDGAHVFIATIYYDTKDFRVLLGRFYGAKGRYNKSQIYDLDVIKVSEQPFVGEYL